MNLYIQTESKVPIYEQIVGQIKKAILNQELACGDLLPSIRALAKDLEISVITTKRAYTELEEEGLICSVQGKGFYVKAPDFKKLREQQLSEFEKHLLEILAEGKELGLSLKEVSDLLTTLYEE